MNSFPVDLVYLWVDGKDPKWLSKKNSALIAEGKKPEKDAAARYFDNDELKYNLRSVEKFAPWINHIFIITDNQIPKWLNTKNKKITIVDHSEIIPKKVLPIFNSSLIEFFIQNIPNLSEHFLLANDDTFFGNNIYPEYFFDKKTGMPIIRAKSSDLIKKSAPDNNYDSIVLNSKKFLMKILGNNHSYNWTSAHNIDPFVKSVIQNILEFPIVNKELLKMLPHKFRRDSDMHRTIFHEYMLANGQAKIKIYTKIKKIWLKIIGRYDEFPQYVTHAKKLEKMRTHGKMPKLFCINNSGINLERDKYNHAFLNHLLPDKSEFEK